MTRRDFQSEIARYATEYRLPAAELSSTAWTYLSRSRTSQEFSETMETFIVQHGLLPTTFGVWAMNDSRFLFDVRNGRTCSHATVEKVCLFMAAHAVKAKAKAVRLLNHYKSPSLEPTE